jgi:hypothetical protein
MTYSALRKLPGILANTLGPHHLPFLVADDNTDIRPETFSIDHVAARFPRGCKDVRSTGLNGSDSSALFHNFARQKSAPLRL